MSADVLREAARLMRERAEAAEVGPWHYVEAADGANLADCWGLRLNAEHIASWHPAVALAVADWLGNTAAAWTFSKVTPPGAVKAEAVARAYLGESA